MTAVMATVYIIIDETNNIEFTCMESLSICKSGLRQLKGFKLNCKLDFSEMKWSGTNKQLNMCSKYKALKI